MYSPWNILEEHLLSIVRSCIWSNIHLKWNIVGIEMSEGNSWKLYVAQYEHVLKFENVLLELVGE